MPTYIISNGALYPLGPGENSAGNQVVELPGNYAAGTSAAFLTPQQAVSGAGPSAGGPTQSDPTGMEYQPVSGQLPSDATGIGFNNGLITGQHNGVIVPLNGGILGDYFQSDTPQSALNQYTGSPDDLGTMEIIGQSDGGLTTNQLYGLGAVGVGGAAAYLGGASSGGSGFEYNPANSAPTDAPATPEYIESGNSAGFNEPAGEGITTYGTEGTVQAPGATGTPTSTSGGTDWLKQAQDLLGSSGSGGGAGGQGGQQPAAIQWPQRGRDPQMLANLLALIKGKGGGILGY